MSSQGLADPAGRITNDAPGLQLAIALGASVYLLSEKKRVPRGESSLYHTIPFGFTARKRPHCTLVRQNNDLPLRRSMAPEARLRLEPHTASWPTLLRLTLPQLSWQTIMDTLAETRKPCNRLPSTVMAHQGTLQIPSSHGNDKGHPALVAWPGQTWITAPAGKAAGITGAGLLAGVLLGAALQSWLRVDIVPIAVSSQLPGIPLSWLAMFIPETDQRRGHGLLLGANSWGFSESECHALRPKPIQLWCRSHAHAVQQNNLTSI